MPPYHSMWSTPTIQTLYVHLGHSSTTLSASHHHAWQSDHSPSTVRKRNEQVSADMTVDRIEEEWRMTRKLGSLLGEAEDVARRKQLANVAFRKLSTVWFRRAHISLQLRLRLYASFVIPVLTYNIGTWGLTQAELVRIDTYHRTIFARSSVSTGPTGYRTWLFTTAAKVDPSASPS